MSANNPVKTLTLNSDTPAKSLIEAIEKAQTRIRGINKELVSIKIKVTSREKYSPLITKVLYPIEFDSKE